MDAERRLLRRKARLTKRLMRRDQRRDRKGAHRRVRERKWLRTKIWSVDAELETLGYFAADPGTDSGFWP